jgi:DNA-binding response OmpR family regulator
MMDKLLLVEDDATLSRMLRSFLEGEGFHITTVTGQADAERRMNTVPVDLALVDISLSDGDGFGVCSHAKTMGIPVIFLTASGDEYSVVRGLDMGGDDYIAKPFRPRELVSRIRNVLRRVGKRQSVVSIHGLTVDTDKGTVTKHGQEIFLSALEYRLLLIFLNHRGQILSRNLLLEEIWDSAGDFVSDNTLTVYIKRLRDKIETDPAQPEIIKTVRGLGYRMEG